VGPEQPGRLGVPRADRNREWRLGAFHHHGARTQPRAQHAWDGQDAANAGRKTIPFARFDAKRCAQGLEALRSYRTEWDEKARAFKKTPEHNWASHGADAWRYLSLSWRAPMREPEPEKVPIGIALPDMTMDQFMDLEDSRSMREDRV
jgi:hypothetical protein